MSLTRLLRHIGSESSLAGSRPRRELGIVESGVEVGEIGGLIDVDGSGERSVAPTNDHLVGRGFAEGWDLVAI